MLRPMILAALAAAAASSPLVAQKPAGAPAAPAAPAMSPEAERAAIAFAETRGRLLYGLDRAAWVATDDFVARVPNYQTSGARGYVVEQAGQGFAVTFYGGPAEAPVAVYRGEVRSNRVAAREVFPAASRPALTPAQRRLVSARDTAVAALRERPCGSSPFNTAIVPPAAPDAPIDVYFMTPQPTAGAYPLGGHWRMTVAADGTISGQRAFARSCLVLGGGPAPRGARPAGMVASHLLDPVPTEIHVFTSLAAGIPLFIEAGGRSWAVNGGTIRQMRR